MRAITYGIVEESYRLKGETRVAYGVVAYADAGELGTATIVASAHDVTPRRAEMEDFVADINRGRLSLRHFIEAVEDFLAQ